MAMEGRRVRSADIAFASVVVVLGLVAYFWVIPREVQVTGGVGLAPDMFPRAATLACVAFAALLLVQRVLRWGPSLDAASPMPLSRWGFLTTTTAILLLAIYGFREVGFLLTASLLVAVLMRLAGCRSMLLIATVSIGSAALLYLGLWKVMEIALP